MFSCIFEFMNLLRFIFLLILFTPIHSLIAQPTPVGQWQSYFTYTSSTSTACVGNKVFFGQAHLLEYDTEEKSFTTYSKVNGLSDINIQLLCYDPSSQFMIIVYSNSNIDLFKDNVFYNIPDIKNLNVIGSKQIHNIYFRNKLIYISSDLGIIVLDPIRKEIKETYKLELSGSPASVNALDSKGGLFYALTNKGIFTADQSNPNLQNFTNWTLINPKNALDIVNLQDSLYIMDSTSVYKISNTSLDLMYAGKSKCKRLKKGVSNFYLCESSASERQLRVFDVLGNLVDSVRNINPSDVVEKSADELWIADIWEGSIRIVDRSIKDVIRPNGINLNSVYNLSYADGDMFVSAGNISAWNVSLTPASISRLKPNGDWIWYTRDNGTAGLEDKIDILDVAYDKRTRGMYAASFADGLWEWKPDNTSTTYKNTPYIVPYGGSNRLADVEFDNDYNLWMTNYGSDNQLVVKLKDGTWQKFSLPSNATERTATQIVIDDANQKWVLAPRGLGVYVYNDNNSISNKNDDKVKLLTKGVGSGNLPTSDPNCIEKDKTGKIWIGSSSGIGIFNCPESIFTTEGCDAELKIVKYDADAGLLFQGENIKSIATDGANNKWIGSENGVWLISDDAEKILQRFTTDNSPLPSNSIRKILVHPISGEVFIATEQGLVSFRGDATEGAASNDDILVFPNPVPSNFEGTIAIKGLVTNADVRITDVSGQLVFRTKAQGGQAVWNGKNYTGFRPRSGVYYVFVTNEDGSETKTTKFIYNE